MSQEYYECEHCEQVVQGFEAAHSLPQPCPEAPDHKWVRAPGPYDEDEDTDA